LIDFNRAGVPLIEAVTEAELCSSEEAHEYLVAFKEILQYAGVSDCDMEKGSLRCDVNVSVRLSGELLRTKVEIKNLNSFRHVRAAIDYEVERQIDAYEGGDPALFPVQETRLFDAERSVTRTMRGKEDEADYRYFPDPDLVPITLDPRFLDRERGYLPELPAARRERYQREMGLSPYDAGVLTGERAVADFFEMVARLSNSPKEAANWVQNEILRALADPELPARTIDELLFRPADLAEVIELVAKGAIHKSAARQVVAELLRAGGSPRAIVEAKGLTQVQDDGAIESWCREALATRAKIVADVRAGNAKALGALIGPVMQLSGGKANPQRVRELLARLIEEGG
jgi:aspartyl-tRNA(Asn)/glutamyl-tRNA(Gln) amidotransferase subunit B